MMKLKNNKTFTNRARKKFRNQITRIKLKKIIYDKLELKN